MKTKTMILAGIAAAVTAAGGIFLYNLGMERGAKAGLGSGVAASGNAGQTGAAAPGNGRKVLYWHDPMVPGQKFDKPGKSPFMDMALVPVYAGEAGDEGKVSISARMQQNLGVRTVPVTKGKPDVTVQAVGSIGYNERDVALVQARGNGQALRAAGLQSGDVILEVNGMNMNSLERATELEADLANATDATIRYERDGQVRTTTMRIER